VRFVNVFCEFSFIVLHLQHLQIEVLFFFRFFFLDILFLSITKFNVYTTNFILYMYGKRRNIKHICISCWFLVCVIKINQMGGRLRYEPRLSLSFIWFLVYLFVFWVLVRSLQRHLVVEIPSTRLS